MSLGDKLCEPIDNHVLSLDGIAHVKKSSFKIKMPLIVKLVTNFAVCWVTEYVMIDQKLWQKQKTKAFCDIKDSLRVNKNLQRGSILWGTMNTTQQSHFQRIILQDPTNTRIPDKLSDRKADKEIQDNQLKFKNKPFVILVLKVF